MFNEPKVWLPGLGRVEASLTRRAEILLERQGRRLRERVEERLDRVQDQTRLLDVVRRFEDDPHVTPPQSFGAWILAPGTCSVNVRGLDPHLSRDLPWPKVEPRNAARVSASVPEASDVMAIQVVGHVIHGVSVEKQMRQLAVGFSSERNVRVEMPQPNLMVIVRRYTPGWAIALAVVGLIVFLLGLLFLLVKSEERTTILAEDVEGGSKWTITGAAHYRVRYVLKQQFPRAGISTAGS